MTQVSRRAKCVLMLGHSLSKGAARAGAAVGLPAGASGGRSVFLGWPQDGALKRQSEFCLFADLAETGKNEQETPMSEMKAAVRCHALDMAGLAAQEAHGKRMDRISRKRKVRDVPPIVAGGLNLRELYDAHIDGVKQNRASKKPVLQFLVRFPPELLDGEPIGRFAGNKADRQKMMLRQAVKFIQETHGGSAVFAARIDRDEAGETIVDVFATPRYEKRTKRTRADRPGPVWASATKFGKELAERHQAEIRRRHPEAKGSLTGPRAVGIALQSEFASFFERVNGVPLAPKVEKEAGARDRLETEAYKEIQEQREKLRRAMHQLTGFVGRISERLGLRAGRTVDAALIRIENSLGPDPGSATPDSGCDPLDDAGLRG